MYSDPYANSLVSRVDALLVVVLLLDLELSVDPRILSALGQGWIQRGG
jgi:hypothetical protein